MSEINNSSAAMMMDMSREPSREHRDFSPPRNGNGNGRISRKRDRSQSPYDSVHSEPTPLGGGGASPPEGGFQPAKEASNYLDKWDMPHAEDEFEVPGRPGVFVRRSDLSLRFAVFNNIVHHVRTLCFVGKKKTSIM